MVQEFKTTIEGGERSPWFKSNVTHNIVGNIVGNHNHVVGNFNVTYRNYVNHISYFKLILIAHIKAYHKVIYYTFGFSFYAVLSENVRYLQ